MHGVQGSDLDSGEPLRPRQFKVSKASETERSRSAFRTGGCTCIVCTHMQSEINFLKYRLQVVQTWPDSDRKRATIAAILSQLERHTGSKADAE